MVEILDYVYPDGVCSAKWEWEAFGGERCGFLWLRRKPVTVTLCAGDVEPDPNYRGPEPDEGEWL
jgi:hypothetical protein